MAKTRHHIHHVPLLAVRGTEAIPVPAEVSTTGAVGRRGSAQAAVAAASRRHLLIMAVMVQSTAAVAVRAPRVAVPLVARPVHKTIAAAPTAAAAVLLQHRVVRLAHPMVHE
jgi:hypothetical protein